MLENGEYWSVIESAEDLEDAVQLATEICFIFPEGQTALMEEKSRCL
jgi:hypothetical protein